MPDLVAIAVAALAFTTAFLGLLVAGAVLRYAGREPGRTWTQLTAFVTGGMSATAVMVGWPSPFLVVLFLGLAAVTVGTLAMKGRWSVAGFVVLGAAVPWTIVAASVVVDGARGDRTSDASAAPWWLVAGLIALGIGVVAIRRVDAATRNPHHLNPVGEPGSRRVGNLSRQMMRDRAIGGVDMPTSVALVLGVVAALAAQALVARPGVAYPASAAVAVLVFAVVATETGFVAIPRAQRAAIEAMLWLREQDVADFAYAGGGRPPGSPKAAKEWLATHPDADTGGHWRVDIIAWTGDLAAARRAADALPGTSPLDRFMRAAQRAWVDWMDGAPIDLPALTVQARSVGGSESDDRLRAEAVVAAIASQVAVAGGGDWKPPLVALRQRLGVRANGVIARSYRRTMLRFNLLLGTSFAVVTALIPGFTG